MSWLQSLADTYDYLYSENLKNPGSVMGLTPPATIEQKSQLQITLNEDSELVFAGLVADDEASTVVPATEASANRTSGIVPHRIFDNLEYMAGDLEKYWPDKKGCREKRFVPYIQNLKKWLDYDQFNRNLQIVYEYLVKETLIEDLIRLGCLKTLENGLLESVQKHQGYTVDKYFTRISIDVEGEQVDLWREPAFLQAYSQYYMNEEASFGKDLCYVSGKNLPIATLHGKNIRRPGDGAKLISSNDSQNFTYRGRFTEASEAVGISYELSEKAHSALRWLIKRQAYRQNDYVVLAYSSKEEPVQPFGDTEEICDCLLDAMAASDLAPTEVSAGKNSADELRLAIRGYKNRLQADEKTSLITLDNATPGRLAIQYFREFHAGEYLENILYYHQTMQWTHRYKKGADGHLRTYVGTPSALELINHVFGVERSGFMKVGNDQNKLQNQLLQRLLPLITERGRVPRDFMKCAFESAITPLGKSYYNWQKCLSIACGIIKKYYMERKGVEYRMALDRTLQDRSYLYGRLLAIAERIERDAYKKDNSGNTVDRQTNAMRYMNALAKHPYRTWPQIEMKLQPYLKRLESGKRVFYQKELGEVMQLFDLESYQSNKELEGTFVLGFHCQIQSYFQKKDKNDEEIILDDNQIIKEDEYEQEN
ncbi:MAG: type I-C CRISPR-associated protein Cas8c/Csd1 [Saccharofermentanales bacterium]|jgi:CRISPR-associated protein Csd1